MGQKIPMEGGISRAEAEAHRKVEAEKAAQRREDLRQAARVEAINEQARQPATERRD